MIEKEFGCNIRCLYTDNGGEFTSKEFIEYLHRCGIR